MSDNAALTVLGAVVGMTYGLMAVGLIVIFRSGRLINFAYGSVGAFGGAMFGSLASEGMPYYAALPVGIVVGAGVSVATEFCVMRRLKAAPTIVKIVATIGVATFLDVFALAVAPTSTRAANLRFPRPPGLPEFDLGVLRVSSDYTAMLLFSPVVVAALVLFLQRSRFGVAIRAAAANEDAARLDGISANLTSTVSWALAGGLSAFTAILLIPSLGSFAAGSLGPGLLVRGLAAAVLARMTSLPVGLACGVGIGIVEQHLVYREPSLSRVNVILLIVIVVALLLQQRGASTRRDDGGSWLSVQVPRVRQRHAAVAARTGWSAAVIGLTIGVLLPGRMSSSSITTLTGILCFTIIGLSLGLVSGLAGQISLGQFGVAATGAAASYLVVDSTDNFILSFIAAAFVGASASVLLGLPAVRIAGLMFAVVTLSFGLAVPWLLGQSWLFDRPQDPGRPVIGDFALDNADRYYYFVLAFFVLSLLMARNVWRSGAGRRFRAVRDNESAARAFAVRANAVKLQAFALGGGLAGIGGALYAHALTSVPADAFSIQASLTLVAILAVGGIGSLIGPLLGAAYIMGVPLYLPLDTAGLAATSLGWLVLLMAYPGGLVQALVPLRDRLLSRIGTTGGGDHDRDGLPGIAAGLPHLARSDELARHGSELLTVHELRRTYGGVVAVDSVSLEVRAGEILGLIGPNGAGKTTLFELVGGFARPESGRVVFRGRDITGLTPEARARIGLVRSFQDARLFPTLTVSETVQLSLERRRPTRVLRETIGMHGRERAKRLRALELTELMGLSSYAEKQISELSTGTRRITELACLVALEPELLLLDEPTSGIAQRESEALGDVLREIRNELGTTMVIVEHDIPLIMGLADRIVAMASGSIVTVGVPSEVRRHPGVVASYLGGSATAIARSVVGAGELHGNPSSSVRCSASTRGGTRCTRKAVGGDFCTQHSQVLVEARA